MTAQNKTTIKGYFETGDKPTAAEFTDLVDSYLDHSASLGAISDAITSAAAAGTFGFIKLASASGASIVPSGSVGELVVASETAASALSELDLGTAGSAQSALGFGDVVTYSVGSAAGAVPVFTAAKSLDGLADGFSGTIVSPSSGTSYTLDQRAVFPYTIEWFAGQTSAGAAGVNITVSGASVTGTAVEVSASEVVASATGSNAVAVGDTVKLVCTSASSASNLGFTVKVVRT